MSLTLEWVPLDDHTEVMRTPGGWCIHTYTAIIVRGREVISSEALCKIADPNHEMEMPKK